MGCFDVRVPYRDVEVSVREFLQWLRHGSERASALARVCLGTVSWPLGRGVSWATVRSGPAPGRWSGHVYLHTSGVD